MDIIKYGFSEIDAAAADIQTTASRIGSLLHTLKSTNPTHGYCLGRILIYCLPRSPGQMGSFGR